MKVSGKVKEITVTQRNLAMAIGITPARVSQLVKEGVVIRNESDKGGGVYLYESVKNYWLTQAGPSTSDDGSELNFELERAKHERTKREIAEIKLQKMERSVYDAKTVELVMTEMYSNLRTQLLGLPAKLAPQLEGKTKEEIYALMTKEIEAQLAELSKYSPELFVSEVEDGDSDEDRE